MNLDDLEAVWSSVSPPNTAGGIAGRRASGLPHDRPVYLAVDDRGHRHLLVQVPDNTPAINQKETRSLQVSTSRFEVGSNPESLYVDLACVDSSQNPTFSAVAQDLIRTLQSSHGPVRDAMLNGIARWRAFWSSRTVDLTREEAVGLFGELWFMLRWLGPVTSSVIDRWQVTLGARHDFQWPAVSVEIKTAVTPAAGEPVHQITNLDQLADPEQGNLYLFSLQVREDALSANTLHSLVDRIASDLDEDFHGLTTFNEKLAVFGYTPADTQHAAQPLRILAERLYRVADGFPRLTLAAFQPDGIPPGIKNVSYEIDLANCTGYLFATSPIERPKVFAE